ncbi:hypothetical protein JOM56_005617 [Amanita muscaria]
MFDAGRQPLATLQSNTPEPKRSVQGRKNIADVFFCPKATNPWADPSHGSVDASKVLTAKKSVQVLVDVFFSPQAVRSPVPYTWNEVDVEDTDDDDIPIAQLKKIALSSLATGPSNLRRVPRVEKRTSPKESCDPDDEDLLLSRVQELLIASGRQPAPLQSIPGSPPPFTAHTLLRPATVPMKCIVPHCPFGWHDYSNAVSH